MKVHIYGNTLNSAYHLTKSLREMGVDAEMFLDNSSALPQDFPWWDDPNVSVDRLPEWLHYYDTFPNFLFPTGKTRRMIDDFAKCDVAMVSCYGPILAMKAKVPFLFHSLGSDLNMIDLWDDFRCLVHNSYPPLLKLKKLIKMATFSRLQKRALIRHADLIVCYAGYQFNTYLAKYGLAEKTVKSTYPKDILGYEAQQDPELTAEYAQYDAVYFMISRHSWRSVWNDPKGNDKFIRAFARFLNTRSPNVILLMPEKGVDVDASKRLVSELGIDGYVHWFPDMPKPRLRNYLSLPNVVVVDNFWHDRWFDRYPLDRDRPRVVMGFGSLEALSCKALLLTSARDRDFYGGEAAPILDAFTEDEIFARLVEVSTMSEARKDMMRQAGYDFALKWHEQTRLLPGQVKLLQKIVETRKSHSGGKRASAAESNRK